MANARVGAKMGDRSGQFWIDFKGRAWTSLVVQWLRIHLPMQRTWVQSLIHEDPICYRATKPMYHNY